MQSGESFRVSQHTRFRDRHIYYILSDPEQDPAKVVIANLTSYEPNEDDSCILEAGDHSTVTNRSCIRYGSARICSMAHIEDAIRRGLVDRHGVVSPRVLTRMHRGAGRSKFLPQECRELLKAQGLLS